MTITTLKLPKTKTKRAWLSVGLKMMLGVGLISNLCIGLLMYVNITAFFQIESRTNDLLDVNASMNEHLRASIFDLQKKYLEIPKVLATDPAEQIISWIKTRYSAGFVKEEQIKGAEKYRQFFNRSQRRDISNGRFVVQSENEHIFISKGLLNKDGSFSEAIVRIQLASQFPEQDISQINAQIKTTTEAGDSEDALKQKIMLLKSQLADEALTAETARNQILYKIEDIQKQKTALIQYRQEKRTAIAVIAILAVVINLVMLHLMARFVVEKPLKYLTQAIEAINCGQTICIPFQGRKDRIGILAGALKDFQGALTNLQKEDQRKKSERIVIQELICKMSGLIDGLQKKAIAMKATAKELSGLAADTEDHTLGATRSASKTVEQTNTVSTSTRQLQSAATDISTQVSKQNELITDINEVIRTSREDICELTKASEQITGIIQIVKNIAKETKLLALNARIEAARSGEAGKGFAVVAGEVRELSIQTEVANADIAEKIESIQQVSHIIIANTKKIEARIENLMDASFQISAAVEQQTGTTAGIARNAQATSHDIKDVSDRITKVTQAAQSTSRFAQTVQSLSENIAIELSALLNETRDKLSM
ncbi:MAG: methyl-accepting chemotaxis protein, partial [Pseudomonadota bacterium]